MTLPLEGVRVLDFTWIELGPVCTQVLGDFGADVIKIERPGRGDPSRDHILPVEGEDPVFVSLNRNKRSLVVDLKRAEGRDVIRRLVPTVDVLVENFRPAVMPKLGMGYEDLRPLNPRLVYASGSGFGSDGPYQHKPGMDTLAQSLSGMMMTNARQGVPLRVKNPIADFSAGNLLVQGILLALLARGTTGVGQQVRVSLLDAMVACQLESVVWLNTGRSLNWGDMPISGPFRTKDGYITIVDAFRPRLADLCRVLGIEDLSQDPRFCTTESQMAHAGALRARLSGALAARTTAEWLAELEAIDFLCSPVLTVEEALSDPQVVHNGMVVEVDHPQGRMRTLGPAVKLTGTPAAVRRAPPLLGQHTDELLREAGFSDEEAARMRRGGVVE